MYFMGFSINNFTLLALTLAIGIVVDDAIIVLENAYRHQEELARGPGDGGDQRHPGDRLRRHRDHHLAGGGVHAARLSQGLHRPALQRVRRRGGGLGDHLGLRGPDADPDALRQDPPGPSAARPALPDARGRLQPPGLGLCADPGARVAASRRGRASARWRHAGARGSSSARWSGSSFRPKTAAGSSPSSSHPRARRWPTPMTTSGGRKPFRRRRRRSRATSAW